MCPYIFRPLPDYLLSWFSECSLSSTKLDDSCKKRLTPKKIRQIIFRPNFFDPIFFSAKKKFDPNFFWPTKVLTQIFFYPKFFQTKFFRAKKRLTKKNFNHKFFWPKKISGQKKFDLIFHDFGLGFWDLGFRIWGSGSVTWDSGFRIQDLGRRICYLDSSWPTDPFDQLGVAQLSQIFFFLFP